MLEIIEVRTPTAIKAGIRRSMQTYLCWPTAPWSLSYYATLRMWMQWTHSYLYQAIRVEKPGSESCKTEFRCLLWLQSLYAYTLEFLVLACNKNKVWARKILAWMSKGLTHKRHFHAMRELQECFMKEKVVAGPFHGWTWLWRCWLHQQMQIL